MMAAAPDPIPVAGDTEAMPYVVAEPVRRRLASSDPDVLALYERLVIAREGARNFAQACLIDGDTEWYATGAHVEQQLDRLQRRVEALK
jgi:hypothetical protein